MKKKILTTIVALFIVLITMFFVNRGKVNDFLLDIERARLPKAVSYEEVNYVATIDGQADEVIKIEADFIKNSNENNKQLEKVVILLPKEAINLDIPFTSQAPYAVWDDVHKETCEETSALMAARFVLGQNIIGPADADQEILKLVDWQKRFFGFWKDTDAEKTAELIKGYYGLKDVEVKYDITIDDIKSAVANGSPVIVPVAGRELGNPYYTQPGPYYHMLVVKGYTKDRFITNDPGTKRGEDYLYDFNVLYNAIHDWNSGDVAGGRKAMIVVK